MIRALLRQIRAWMTATYDGRLMDFRPKEQRR